MAIVQCLRYTRFNHSNVLAAVLCRTKGGEFTPSVVRLLPVLQY